MDLGNLAQLGLGGIGELLSGISSLQQQAILQQALAEFGKIDVPGIQKVMGEQLGPSAMEGVKADPQAVAAQRTALDRMMQLAQSGGLTLEDKAALAQVQSRVARNESATRGRIGEQMAMRGGGGGGAELQMLLSNQQAGAERAAEGGQQVAATAQKRALDAMMQGGQMASQLRGQDYSEQARKAEAADAISRYNAGARSQANYWNAAQPQQQFQDRMQRAEGMSSQYGNLANHYGQQAGGARDFWGGGMGVAANRALSGRRQPPQDAYGRTGTGYAASNPDEWENPYGGY